MPTYPSAPDPEPYDPTGRWWTTTTTQPRTSWLDDADVDRIAKKTADLLQERALGMAGRIFRVRGRAQKILIALIRGR